MPKNPNQVAKFILKLAEILQVTIFNDFSKKSINKVSDGHKMELGYK